MATPAANPLVAEQVKTQQSLVDAVVEQMMEVKVLHASGKSEIVRIPAPSSLDTLTPFQVAAIMQAAPGWKECSIEFLINVQLWCKANGLDPVTGDVYLVDGKVNTTDIAKIKFAYRSGKIESLEVGNPVEDLNPGSKAKDVYVEVRLKLKGEEAPRVTRSWKSEWYNPKNANWQARPNDALMRKAMARACHFAVPIGSEGDEFIAATPEAPKGGVSAALAEQKD